MSFNSGRNINMPEMYSGSTSKSTPKIVLQKRNPSEVLTKRTPIKMETTGAMNTSNTSSSIRVEMENTLVQLCDMWFYEIKPALVRDNVKIRCDERNGHSKMPSTPCLSQHIKGNPTYPGGYRANNMCGDAEFADPLRQLDKLLVDCASKINVAVSSTAPGPVRVAPRHTTGPQHQNQTKTHNAKKTYKGRKKPSLVKQGSTIKRSPKTLDQITTFYRQKQFRVGPLEKKQPHLQEPSAPVNHYLYKLNIYRKQKDLLKLSIKRGLVDIFTVRAYFPNFGLKCHKKTKKRRRKKNVTFQDNLL